MACDSLLVLSQLVRTKLWSKRDSLFTFKRIIIDADSVVSYLYQQCVSAHIQRQKKSYGNLQQLDLYSSTIVDYGEYSDFVHKFFDFFLGTHKLVPIIVYSGKYMEAPLHGLLAAEFTKHTQQVIERIAAILDFDKRGLRVGCNPEVDNVVARPNLALIIFKSIVNERRKNNPKILVHQAYYSPYPIMAKLARDFECPVLTGDGEFIVMDVRAGFVLLDDFLSQYLTTGSTKNASSSSKGQDTIDFQYNYLFLHQHPGLNPALALFLFPLTTVDFLTEYSKSLKRLKVFNTLYSAKDFAHAPCSSKQQFRRHHLAANRLEMAITFLSGRSREVLGSLIRSEATRTNTAFDDDILQLHNHYAVAYDFKFRLRFILKYIEDPIQLSFIESCLVERECTAHNLLNLLCCSIGHLASVSYNNRLQFEDLETKNSANSLLNHQKAMLMSLFSANKVHKSEQSLTVSDKKPDSSTRYPNATLTIVDRDKAEIIEHEVTTTYNDPQLVLIRAKLTLSRIARGEVKSDTSSKFINLVYKTSDLTQAPKKFKAIHDKFFSGEASGLGVELSIFYNLFEFCISTAGQDDQYFNSTYSSLRIYFQTAILNHFLYISHTNFTKKHDLEPLKKLISDQNGTSLTNSDPNKKGKKDSTSKHIRHLMELLNAAIEAYCELNSFFNYPLPKLNLTNHYNPILMFNLAFYMNENPDTNLLIKF